ncbi:AAA family ATPase [Streptantibioticus rubrisoli]|uniref:LuxR family transcriptional regulator n=1 Tax=Streptantibioticus rubrisoli TaxID=1387313 RepID=A0ABT1PGI0_9ACTN|nr:AAA family ATPase [Streptantibioticus rubrisoli]MCQ4043906.1 LuxR family transcriptional regulator [Streptantibioticus rubrisoli]
MREPALTGRDGLLETARDAVAAHRAVLFHGPAGIGRSGLLDALVRQLPPAAHVLRCAPASEDQALPYAGLIDLLAQVPREVLDDLPPEPVTALRAALLRGREPSGGHSRLAVRVAVLEVLRRLAACGGVLLVVDDLQWLDGPSAAVLAFVMRRLDGADVRMAATERVPDGEQPERLRCCPPDAVELPVPPLSTASVTRLLRAATGTDLPPPVLRAVQRTAAGNPLYALELGRAVLREGAPDSPDGPLPVPHRLRTRLLDRFRTLPEPVRRTLLVCAAAVRPTLTVLHAAGLTAAAAQLAAAERLGLAGTDSSGAVRFRHPVIRAAVYADATAHARREAHAVLAAAVTEPVEQARHLALAHPLEDAATAATLLAAAASARRRGAPGAAAELAVLAARRTPSGRPAEQAERWLAAADYACDAGQRAEADRAARIVLAGSDSPRQRVRARLILLRNAGQALEGTGSLIEDGLRDAAQDPALQARLYHWAALRGLLCGELTQAARYAERAAAAGDGAARAASLTTLARIRSLAGRPAEADAALAAALTLVGGADGGPESWALVRMRAVLALDSDRVAEAHAAITELLRGSEGLAGVEDRLAALVALTRVQVRSGDCRRALRTAARCTGLLTESGVESAPALYAAALAATAGGTPQEAHRLAERAVRASEADGDQLFLLRALAVLGQAALLTGDTHGAAAAVEALRRAKRIGAAMSAADPPLLQWHGDLAEALVMLGETDAAGSVIQEAYRLAVDPPGSVFAALERAEGLREAALGRAKEGAARLRRSADRLRELPLPLELVRTLIALGAVERRGRHRGAARAALTEALETARGCGAAPLQARAAEELARLDAVERGGGPELTATEARIAELVGGGATNREVAAELFISVKTVEGTLSRVYRKFGVRSRTALAHAMAVGARGGEVITRKLASPPRELGSRTVDIPG